MSTRTCFQYGGPNKLEGAKTDAYIQLDQRTTGRQLFTVTYGLQQTTGLTYAAAAKELGECILHHLCCEDLASNEGA